MNEMKAVLEELKAQGWTLNPTNRNHIEATPPDPSKDIVHLSTRGENRNLPNSIRDLRRSGFQWPPPPRHAKPSREEAPAAEPEQIEPPSAPPAPEVDLDQMWLSLKESRAYLELADEHLVECRTVAERATAALEQAKVDRAAAAERMKQTKVDFDRAFEANGA